MDKKEQKSEFVQNKRSYEISYGKKLSNIINS